ncbi:MAG: ATP-binding protein [Candidatus Poribacteria bacterium]
MDVNRLLLILIMFATLALGFFVLSKAKKNPVNIAFVTLSVTIAVWTFFIFMVLTLWYYKNPIWWVRGAYASGTFMATNFATFALSFLHERFQPIKKYIIMLIPLSVIMALVTLSPILIDFNFTDGKITDIKYGIGNKIWSLYIGICLAITYYSLIKKLRKGSGIEKQKVKYMFLGIVPTTTFMAFTNILIPAWGYEKIVGYGPFFTMIMIGCIGYAIVKLRLMDIRVFIRKGIVYSLILAGSAIFIMLVIIGIPYAFPDAGRIQNATVAIITIIFFAFALRPFIRDIKTLIQAFVFKEQKHYQYAIDEFILKTAKILQMEKLIDFIFKTVLENVKVKYASIWIRNPKSGLYNIVYSHGFEKDNLNVTISDDSPIISYLAKVKEPIVKDELEKKLPPNTFDEIESDFNSLNAQISVPIIANDELKWIINLGERSNKRMYFDEDISFLKTIMNQSSIAIQNVILHQQVVNMEKLSFLGKLSAELAHEIKNPLVTIRTAFEFLMNGQPDQKIDEGFRNFIALALRETNRINDLIKQLLNLGRVLPPKFEWFDINQVIDDTILLLKPSIVEKNIEVNDLRGDYQIEIYADKDQLKQVFLNIGQNAIEAMRSGGRLTIEVIPDFGLEELSEDDKSYPEKLENNVLKSSKAIIKISDTGKGMSKEELEYIFEPFYTGKISGTGLGLAIVNNIVKEHNGNIKVDSMEGLGTTFTLELPMIRSLDYATKGSSINR